MRTPSSHARVKSLCCNDLAPEAEQGIHCADQCGTNNQHSGALMNRNLVVAGMLAALALSASSAEAQRRSSRRIPVNEIPCPSISPYAGYMMFADTVEGPLVTSLSSSSVSVFGVQANLPLGSTLSVV